MHPAFDGVALSLSRTMPLPRSDEAFSTHCIGEGRVLCAVPLFLERSDRSICIGWTERQVSERPVVWLRGHRGLAMPKCRTIAACSRTMIRDEDRSVHFA